MGARESVSLTFSADLSKLQSELSKIPGMTEKEARIAVKQLERQYTKAETAAKKSASAQKKSFGGIVKAAAALDIAARVASAGAAVFDLAQKFADLNNQLTDASSRTGASVEMLAALKLAAEGSGLAFETLERGVGRLPKSMVDAQKGIGVAAQAFKELGVDADVNGVLRDTDDVMTDLFGKLSAIESPAKKAALAMDIFGKTAGPAFIQSGAIDNLDAFVTLSKEYGLDVGPKATAQAAEFQRQMATLSMVTDGQMQAVLGLFGGPGGMSSLIEIAIRAVIILGGTFEAVFSQIQENILMLTGPIAEVAGRIAEGDLIGAFRALRRTSGEFASGLAGLIPGVNAIRLMGAALDGVVDSSAKADEVIALMYKTTESGGKKNKNRQKDEEDGQNKITEAVEKTTEAQREFEAAVAHRVALAASEAEAAKELDSIRAETATAEAKRTNDAMALATIRYETEKDALAARVDAAIELGADEVEAAEVYQERLAELEAERIETIKELEADLAEERAQQVAQQVNDAMSVANAYTDLGRAATAAVVNDRMKQGAKLQAFLVANEENLSKAQKKRIRQSLEKQQEAVTKAFRAQQAADIAGIGMSTAAAIMRAYASIKDPVSASVAAAAIAALGGVQAGVVASTSPPTFDLGGMVPMGTQAGSGRHVGATVEAGEGVLTRQGVRAIGGEEAVAAANRGQSSGGSTSVNLMLRHKVLDVILTEHAGRGGTGSTRSTRTNPYRGIAR